MGTAVAIWHPPRPAPQPCSDAVNICYVTETYPPEINGVALTVARTVKFLRDAQHRVDLIRPQQPGEPPSDDGAGTDHSEWRTRGLPIPMYPDLRIGLATKAGLQRRFERTQPDLVHVATQGPLGRAAVLAAAALGIPVTTDFRTNFHWYSRYYRLGWLEPVVCAYLRSFHNRAAATFVPTEAVRRALQQQGFERLEVVARGVDAAHFSPARRSSSLRAQWGVHDDASPVLLYVGRLAPEKNVALALRACAEACRHNAGARTVVVGDGPLRARLEAEFPEARFVGMQRGDALAAHYASGDVFAFPSRSETFGNVTLEAMASGLAVVAFDTAAAGSHIRSGVSGLLVPPDSAAGDAAAFIDATVAALAHAAPDSALRRAGRKAALGSGWDAVLRRFELSLVGHATAAAPDGHKPDVVLA